MYHAIIRRKLAAVFAQLNRKEYGAILDGFAPQFEHALFGAHALGGVRHGMPATARWYERLPRVLPDLTFEVRDIVVSGWPWNTRAAVEWRDSGACLDGHRFNNQGVHVIRIRWGKVTAVRVYCDTMVLADVLQRNAQGGIAEARLAPILD
jgi:ketosteroid isomerase-like protein